ncbi:MAG TPA: hypothetical protein VG759_19635 [Candidatus Angelobacter sp.]|jgi:hypothetical protein|nr:hypothetical protein [Candidatus Angelobacter sp.]
MKTLLVIPFLFVIAMSGAHARSCGIDKALDRYEASDQTYQDALPALKVIMLAEDDDSYMHCEVSELRRAVAFLDTVVQFIRDADQPMATQEKAINEMRGSQRKIRRAIAMLNDN